MFTNIEMDTMRAIVAFSKDYRRQNSFVKLNGEIKIIPEKGDVYYDKREILVRLSDIVWIDKELSKDGTTKLLNVKTKVMWFTITEEEYKEKLQKHINLVV